ncbi:hypothetical protein PCE01_11250 [Pediococcus cellicola]|nr:hypothetical protein PCE01_11250 [Pediococcus cellicola]
MRRLGEFLAGSLAYFSSLTYGVVLKLCGKKRKGNWAEARRILSWEPRLFF